MLVHVLPEKHKAYWPNSNGMFLIVHRTHPISVPATSTCSPQLKVHLGGQRLVNDDEVKSAVYDWLKEMDAEWYGSGIKRLFSRYQKCIDRNGDYVEK